MYTDQLQPLPYLLPTEQNKLYIFIYIYIAVFRQFNKKSMGGSCRVLGINFYPTQQTFIIKVCTYTGLKLLLHTCSGFATIICISIRNKRIDHSRKKSTSGRACSYTWINHDCSSSWIQISFHVWEQEASILILLSVSLQEGNIHVI